MQCPIGSAIREIEVHYNLNVRLGGGRQGTVVTMVVARCYSFADGRRTETLRIDRSDALPSEGANRRTCSRGLWATGIIGRTGGDGARLAGGTLLDALGMVCGPWQLQSTAIPPPDRTPPPQTPNPAREQRVVLPVDVYNQPGGTVTGFLAAGTVLVLPGPCRADNWCQVTGNAVPQGTGWVFSGPSYNALGL